MLRSRGRHHPLRFASVVAVLTLGAFATPTSAAPMVSSPDGTVDAVVSATDQTRPAPKKPPPSPSPTPSPTPDPTPTPEPTPTPTPSPAPTPTPTPPPAPTSAPPPNPTPGAQPTTPDPAVTASTGLFGPTSPGASVIGGDPRSDPGIGPRSGARAGRRRFLDRVSGFDPHPTRLDRKCAGDSRECFPLPRVRLRIRLRCDRSQGAGHRSDLDRPRGRRSVRDPRPAFWARSCLGARLGTRCATCGCRTVLYS